MAINTMEEFVDLYLATRADCGHLIFTVKYPDDFLAWLSNERYADLFSFFYSKKDLDFISYLKSHQAEASNIDIIHRDSGEDTTHFRTDFCYPIAATILEKFDDSLHNQMANLIFDMDRTKDLNRKLQCYSADGIYQTVNPNGIYHLNSGEKLFVDGSISYLGDDTYLAEDSLFSLSVNFCDQKLKKVKVSCLYKQNGDYVSQIVDRIISNNNPNNISKMDSTSFWVEVQKNKVYQHK